MSIGDMGRDMVINKTHTLRTEEEISNRYQDQINDRLNFLSEILILDGDFLTIVEADTGLLTTDIPLVAGQSNLIAHRLQRDPVGFFVADIDTNTNVFRAAVVDTTQDRLFIDLRCGTNCIVKIWIF